MCRGKRLVDGNVNLRVSNGVATDDYRAVVDYAKQLRQRIADLQAEAANKAATLADGARSTAAPTVDPFRQFTEHVARQLVCRLAEDYGVNILRRPTTIDDYARVAKAVLAKADGLSPTPADDMDTLDAMLRNASHYAARLWPRRSER